ncbi:hypothetical protein FRC16_000117 [Serendipita sp. 398]|nr:hypothetical protein FRC16_000117 [Serendipita sp. 398]
MLVGEDGATDLSTLFTELPPYEQGFMCLADTFNNSKWCIIDAFERVKDVIHMPLNIYSVILQIPLLLKGSSVVLSPNVSCTDCSLATYAIARQFSPLVANETGLYNDIVQHCGKDFVGE